MKIIISISLILVLNLSSTLAQIHLEPKSGDEGIGGPVTNSFVIKWASVDNAINYEYIMSDNPLCFAGCPGDTRQRFTKGDTTGTEYNLVESKWYYWITRVYYQSGDTSSWSGISSFLAKNPPEIEADELIKIAPNPSLVNDFTLKIDWVVTDNAKKIKLKVYSLDGKKITEEIIEKSGDRYQDYTLRLPPLTQSIYMAFFMVDGNPNNPNNKITKKLIIIR